MSVCPFQPRALESDTALALNRYLCNAVLPLLTNHSQYFADAEHHAALLDAVLHTVLLIIFSIFVNIYCYYFKGLSNEPSSIVDQKST
jgi:hypothetical protein